MIVRVGTVPKIDVLQWGRARLSAEMRELGEYNPKLSAASMGPRSIERGNSLQSITTSRSRTSFNGAALD